MRQQSYQNTRIKLLYFLAERIDRNHSINSVNKLLITLVYLSVTTYRPCYASAYLI